MNIENLKAKGFVNVKYPSNLRVHVLESIESWKDFCDLPLNYKKELPYSNGGAGIGYEYKEGTGTRADKKENFDVTLAGVEWLKQNIEEIDSKKASTFIDKATSLVGLLSPVVSDFASQVESYYELTDFENEVSASLWSYYVRFIHYFGDRSVGEETATAHTDQSAFTLHLFESDPGLQCLTYDKKDWIDMPVSDGETVIIPAMQMQMRSKGELKALCHRVIATDKTAREGRYSAVCFIQLKNTPKYDKNVSGRLQEREPGFNYEMPASDFSKMFK